MISVIYQSSFCGNCSLLGSAEGTRVAENESEFFLSCHEAVSPSVVGCCCYQEYCKTRSEKTRTMYYPYRIKLKQVYCSSFRINTTTKLWCLLLLCISFVSHFRGDWGLESILDKQNHTKAYCIIDSEWWMVNFLPVWDQNLDCLHDQNIDKCI